MDTKRIPVPNHSPEVMTDPGKPRRVGQTGTMEADVSGKRQHFTFFSKGKNAAVHFEDRGVSWVRLEGALNDDGTPFLSFELEPLRLDTLEYPATFTVGPVDEGQPQLEVRYEIDARTAWVADPQAQDTPMPTLTLVSYEGGKLSGTFEGTLYPLTPEQGPPMKLDHGSFEIELRRTGIAANVKSP